MGPNETFKSLCTTKETISTVKRQPSDWEKIIANEATDKGLISKILTLLRKKKKSQDFFPQKRKISNQGMYEKPGYLL